MDGSAATGLMRMPRAARVPALHTSFAVLVRIALSASVLLALALPAQAACKPGFVAREAGPGDRICVTPGSKARAAAENARTPMLWGPGSYGPRTCALGNVWREAFDGDQTCTTAAIRAHVQQENALDPTRRQ